MSLRVFVSTVSAAMGRHWQFLIGVGMLIFVMVGFDFKTPASQFLEIEHTHARFIATDSLLDTRVARLEEDADETRRYLRALAVAQCLDRPPRETAIMGLACDQLLGGAALAPLQTLPNGTR